MHFNVEADPASRHFHDDTEWSLDTHVYNSLITKWGNPEIDLFASRLNAKLPWYAAWKPDPCAHFIDAFTLDWSVFKLFYCFPPFSVIGKVRAISCDLLIAANATVESQSNFNLQVSLV